MSLFTSCSSYSEYEMLAVSFPDDEFLPLATRALYDRCATIEDYRKFIAFFPGLELTLDAQARIDYIIEELQRAEFLAMDKTNYDPAVEKNTIEAYVQFLAVCQTKAYRDSANKKIEYLARRISKDDIEWRWTNGEAVQALGLIYYKVDYLTDVAEIPWIIDLLTVYTLKHNSYDHSRKALTYLDKLIEQRITQDDYLDLYMSKGFILWSLSEFQLCLNVFELKLEDTYDSGLGFKDAVKVRYKELLAAGVSFPEQAATWKRIRKLKTVD